eukprot:1907831-Amphidinium_carterae.1
MGGLSLGGEWIFELSEPTNRRTSCGHNRPDVAEVQPLGRTTATTTEKTSRTSTTTTTTSKKRNCHNERSYGVQQCCLINGGAKLHCQLRRQTKLPIRHLYNKDGLEKTGTSLSYASEVFEHLSLQEPDVAKTANGTEGRFTLIYDEGRLVKYLRCLLLPSFSIAA